MILSTIAQTYSQLGVSLHVFIEPFTPPVPLIFSIVSGAVAVIGSFVLITIFPQDLLRASKYPRVNLLELNPLRHLNPTYGILFGQIASVCVFFLVIVAGFFGNPDPVYNFAPTFVWVIWWVGVAYTSAFLGDVWSILNPWKIMFGWIENLWAKLKPGRPMVPIFQYPRSIGVMPGLCFFLIFAWIENVYTEAVIPLRISQMVLAYSLFTWLGMLLYGKDIWLRNGEAFSLAFGFLAKFGLIQAPVTQPITTVPGNQDHGTKTSEDDAATGQGHETRSTRRAIYLQPWACGLLEVEKVSVWQTFFLLSLLATVTFDGFTGTLPWVNIQSFLGEFLKSAILIKTLGLIASVLIFISIYFGFAAIMSWTSGYNLGASQAATAFVYTLVPIALAYHLAHFLLFLLIQGQMMVALVSDPFGLGWNLFGTTDYQINFKLVTPNFFWFTSVITIVVGHIIAVLLSHNVAIRLTHSRKYAIRSQFPMLTLMVGYTIASLWILTQPMYA